MKTAIIAVVLAVVCLGAAYVGAPILMPPAPAAPAKADAHARPAAAHAGAAPADTAHADATGEAAHESTPADAARTGALLAAAARVRAAEQEILVLESQQADLAARLAAAHAARDRAAGLAETIVRLEPAARRAVLERLDAEALGYLYGSAPAAVRAGLLDGLPPADAARLVGLLAGPDGPDASEARGHGSGTRLHLDGDDADAPGPAAPTPAAPGGHAP